MATTSTTTISDLNFYSTNIQTSIFPMNPKFLKIPNFPKNLKFPQQSQFLQHSSQEPQQADEGPSSQKGRQKSKAKKPCEHKIESALWTQTKERLLAECFIQVSKDPKVGSDQNNETFWYMILDIYNERAVETGLKYHNKNMLTGKWMSMNREVIIALRYNQVLSGENDEDLLTRV
ncbi:hypothetical protein Tco_1028090 [Tanacetum coccineum]